MKSRSTRSFFWEIFCHAALCLFCEGPADTRHTVDHRISPYIRSSNDRFVLFSIQLSPGLWLRKGFPSQFSEPGDKFLNLDKISHDSYWSGSNYRTTVVIGHCMVVDIWRFPVRACFLNLFLPRKRGMLVNRKIKTKKPTGDQEYWHPYST